MPPPQKVTKDLAAVMPTRIGDFEVMRELGRGSMGIVYEAIQLTLGRRVALKTFPAHGRSAQSLERFKREAGAAAKLLHPGIVPVFAVGADEIYHFYAMQLVEGKTLREIIYTDKLGQERAVRIAKKMAEALDYAHKQGVIHRDVKPTNIIVTSSDQPMITDFGLAKDLGLTSMTAAGIILGTPTHMSPEQALGLKDLDHRTDVYALGACLYEMLTYRLPVYGQNLEELLDKVAKEEPERPRNLDPKIPRDLEAIVLKALAKKPADRYQTAGEMGEDLGRFLNGERVRARPPSALTAVKKWAAKNRGLATAISVVTALSVGVGGALLVRWASTRAEVIRLSSQLEEATRTDTTLALSLLDQVIKLDPANEDAHKRRAELLVVREREQTDARRARNREEAAKHVKRGMAAADRAQTLTGRDAEVASGEAIDALGMALALDPENVSARNLRGRLYLQRALDAERQGDNELAAIYFGFVREHNPDGLYDAALRAEGSLSLRANAPGATATIVHIVPDVATGETRREPWVGPIALPYRCESVTVGSYVIELAAEDHAPAIVPIAIERGQHDELEVRLLHATQIPTGFAYIPGGPIRFGGDPKAIRSLPRERHRVEGFFIAQRETTCADFAAFLDDLPAQDARSLLPRGGPRNGYAALFWDEENKHRYTYPHTWSPDRPVTGVTYDAAVRYAAWRAARDSLPYRLPTEYEWEKAARGADGRGYPWGEADPATHANVAPGADPADAKPVGTTPGDVTIFGVRDMVGNASEWTSSVLDSRLPHHRIVRGGSYMPQTDAPRCASRFPTEVMNPPEHTGFRLACDLPSE